MKHTRDNGNGSNRKGLSAGKVDVIVGDRIRRRRILMGLTQDQLGEALGVSYQQIQKYETGSNRVSAGRLYVLAQTLETSPAWFFEGIGESAAPGDDDTPASSRLAIECVRNLGRISDRKVRSAILVMIRTLAEAEEAGVSTNGLIETAAGKPNGKNGLSL